MRVCVLFFFLSAVVKSATWSNLVAYLWHSLAIVLMDVEGVKVSEPAREGFTKTKFRDGGQRKQKAKPHDALLLAGVAARLLQIDTETGKTNSHLR